MWQLIKLNRRRSLILLAVMAFIMLILGAVIGQTVGLIMNNGYVKAINHAVDNGGEILSGQAWWESFATNPWWLYGMGVAFVIWLVQALVAYYAGGNIMLSMSGAIEIGPGDHPVLSNVVEEMTIAAGLTKQPRIFIIPDESPNAFATGTSPDNAAVAVTAGLLSRLSRDELQGVIAHEMSHIVNRDVMFMTMIGIMLGTIVMLSDIFLHGTLRGSMHGHRYSSRNDRNNGGGGAAIVMIVITIICAIVAPLLAQLVYFATSRKREYLADASAVRLTRNPEGLADALEKIATNAQPMPQANRITAPLYINNPNGSRSLDSLTSTHPPIGKRIEILRKLAGSDGSYSSYEKAFVSVNHGSCVPVAALKDDAGQTMVGKAAVGLTAGQTSPQRPRPAQKATPATAFAPATTPQGIKRQTGDLIMALNDYRILTCDCGLKLKIPPQFKHNKAQCPKCGKIHELANTGK